MIGIDTAREFKDEGIYPGLGAYHMYHRIDGKLVAVGIIDITPTVLNSAYFMYDPDYKFLNLGVVGAVMEMQYMNMIREKFNPNLQYYHLGELSMKCPKVNYKLNYQPGGLILCPETLKWLPYEEVKDIIDEVNMMTIQQKIAAFPRGKVRINPDPNA
jgi:arginyl-tRNA---protein transferase